MAVLALARGWEEDLTLIRLSDIFHSSVLYLHGLRCYLPDGIPISILPCWRGVLLNGIANRAGPYNKSSFF